MTAYQDEAADPCTRLIPGGVHQQHIAEKSINRGLALVHSPSLGTIGFLSPAIAETMCLTVWILRNASSVIFLHLLSMKEFHAAAHKMTLFQAVALSPHIS
ncbi:hypothetical protein [Blastomonas sp.]|uniref:hypothetical protein n=1 Tax=Blastomonas TaxID=150203 RepID=UPI002589826E|nr:hypothetical protein [Blastomonas sp.]